MLAPAGIMGSPHIAVGPTVWALHVPHQSEASSAFRGSFTQTVGSFTPLLSFLEGSPRSGPYMSPRLTLLFPLGSRHFPSHSAFPAAGVHASQQQLLTSGVPLGYPDPKSSSFLLPRAISCGGMEHVVNLSRGKFLLGRSQDVQA